MLFWIIIFSLLGSVGSILLVSIFFLLSDKTQATFVPYLISYATGILLTAAMIGLIPEALEQSSPSVVFPAALFGIVLFFIIEKTVIWRHCHNKTCEVHEVAGPMITIGDAFHNAIDGVVIAASFLASFPLGVIASISMVAHEIPQEIGDFAILVQSGYPRKKALQLNILSSLSTIPTAILAFFTLEFLQGIIPIVMAIAGASFLYIALSDLTPQLHKKLGSGDSIRQLVLVFLGIATIFVLGSLLH